MHLLCFTSQTQPRKGEGLTYVNLMTADLLPVANIKPPKSGCSGLEAASAWAGSQGALRVSTPEMWQVALSNTIGAKKAKLSPLQLNLLNTLSCRLDKQVVASFTWPTRRANL